MMDDQQRHNQLVRALVESVPGASRPFQFNAEFHASVLMVARIWEMVGPTILEQTERSQAEMERQAALLRAGRIL